jgi:hypothetical protein
MAYAKILALQAPYLFIKQSPQHGQGIRAEPGVHIGTLNHGASFGRQPAKTGGLVELRDRTSIGLTMANAAKGLEVAFDLCGFNTGEKRLESGRINGVMQIKEVKAFTEYHYPNVDKLSTLHAGNNPDHSILENLFIGHFRSLW